GTSSVVEQARTSCSPAAASETPAPCAASAGVHASAANVRVAAPSHGTEAERAVMPMKLPRETAVDVGAALHDLLQVLAPAAAQALDEHRDTVVFRPMWIMVAGPYRAESAHQREENLRFLNRAACAVLRKGHVPVIGVNMALPMIDLAAPE